MLSSVVVDLVNGDSGVHDVRLNGLTVNNGLDVLVNVVVDVLASYLRADLVRLGGGVGNALVLELSGLSCETALDVGLVTVLERSVLDGDEVVVMLLGEDLTVLNGLDGGVVVVLVNLTVNGRGYVLMSVRGDSLVGDCGSNGLVDSSVVVTRVLKEVGNSCLCLVHVD